MAVDSETYMAVCDQVQELRQRLDEKTRQATRWASECEDLRQQLAAAKEENERVRRANIHTMDVFEDMRAAMEKAEARVTELSEALQVAVDTPELGGGTWYDMAVAALAERAGGEK